MSLRSLLILLAWMIGQARVTAGELAELGVNGNAASMAAIKSYYAETKLEINVSDGVAKGRSESVFWKTPAGARLIEPKGAGRTISVNYKNDLMEILSLDSRNNANSMAGMKIQSKNFRISEVDPRELSLFSLPVGMTIRKPLVIYSLMEAYQKFELKEEKLIKEEGRLLLFLHLKSAEEHRSCGHRQGVSGRMVLLP